jgi:outer membrane receptor for ferrienterochelin and colicins
MRLLTLILSIMIASGSWAQSTGTLSGSVKDDQGTALPGANIKVVGSQLSTPTGAATGAGGAYSVSSLPPGSYEATASFVGFTSVTESVTISAGKTATIDFILGTDLFWGDQIVVSASRNPEKVLDAPASVSVFDGEQIADVPTLNVAEAVRAEGGVDLAKTGLVQNATVVRGFNNVFSGALMTLMDNRIGRVPSLRVNVNSFIPVTNQDIERIEVVRGPGSALYGPNSANGVMHIITKSPFGSEGTSIGIGGGERSLRNASFRHAGSSNGKVGFKISGQYFAGNDWEYVDPIELQANNGVNPRDYDLEKFTGEARLDFRPNEDTEIIFSAGLSQANLIEMTGLGAAQAKDWKYQHLQGRLIWKDWFAQVFYNKSDAGDTRLIRSNSPIVDKSTLTVFQLQHSAALGDRQRFTYGGDVLWTRPVTEGTISGAHENVDDINEYGGYLQSETDLSDQVELVLAGRYDTHNHLEDNNFSPRAALVIKPDDTRTFRATYNRAFSTPTSNNLFLDLVSTPDAFGIGAAFEPSIGYSPAIDVRALGLLNGFTFNRDTGGLPTYRSPFAPVAGMDATTQIPLHDPVFTNVEWGLARGAVLSAFIPTIQPVAIGLVTAQLIGAGLPADVAAAQAPPTVDALIAGFQAIVPTQLPGLRNSLAALNVQTAGFDPVAVSSSVVSDVPSLEPTITETFELGYKGLVNKRLLITADVYRTDTKDFVGPLKIETPNVFLEGQALATALTASFGASLADPANAQLAAFLAALDDPALGVGGNANGTAVDELVSLFVSGTASNGAAFIPFGTITPVQAVDPAAVTVSYRNFGDVTIYGTDLGFTYFAPNNWTLSANYSFVNKDIFKNVNSIADIALNSPKHKANIAVRYDHPESGFRAGATFRYRGEFPMDSGAYVGTVDAYSAIDLALQYKLPLNNPTFSATLSLNGSNILDNSHQEFIGAPDIGRLVTSGLIVKF